MFQSDPKFFDNFGFFVIDTASLPDMNTRGQSFFLRVTGYITFFEELAARIVSWSLA